MERVLLGLEFNRAKVFIMLSERRRIWGTDPEGPKFTKSRDFDDFVP